jgi:hypothetical protein
MFGKDGTLFCRAFLDWARRQPCLACLEFKDPPLYGFNVPCASDPHHWPVRGMGGAHRRDDQVIPLCRRHHEQAQEYKIPRATQDRWVIETRSAFLDECTVEELRAYFEALEAWKDRPLAVPF